MPEIIYYVVQAGDIIGTFRDQLQALTAASETGGAAYVRAVKAAFYVIEGDDVAGTYCNQTQAIRAAAALGDKAYVRMVETGDDGSKTATNIWPGG